MFKNILQFLTLVVLMSLAWGESDLGGNMPTVRISVLFKARSEVIGQLTHADKEAIFVTKSKQGLGSSFYVVGGAGNGKILVFPSSSTLAAAKWYQVGVDRAHNKLYFQESGNLGVNALVFNVDNNILTASDGTNPVRFYYCENNANRISIEKIQGRRCAEVQLLQSIAK